MKIKYYLAILSMLSIVISSCGNNATISVETQPADQPVETPVTVAGVTEGPMAQYLELNATSSFMQKNIINANANGYLESNFTSPGQYVRRGQNLFTIKTKEAQSIGNAVNQLDSSFKFSGTNAIRAGGSGYITQLNHQAGDYVQDGEQLAIVSDINSFAFVLDLPYELRPYVQPKTKVELILPDGETLNGVVSGKLPSVDPAAQTQSIFIKVNASHPIPENLIAIVRIQKAFKPSTISLPKATVLTDETQSEFWIMKMVDSNTAVKMPVKKGIESSGMVEILYPVLSASDKILLTGNFGLADTAKVKITR
ncbi:MAG: efflux RND transporter periplasmic adaptor subunit [Chitinophagaceae bacterium]